MRVQNLHLKLNVVKHKYTESYQIGGQDLLKRFMKVVLESPLLRSDTFINYMEIFIDELIECSTQWEAFRIANSEDGSICSCLTPLKQYIYQWYFKHQDNSQIQYQATMVAPLLAMQHYLSKKGLGYVANAESIEIMAGMINLLMAKSALRYTSDLLLAADGYNKFDPSFITQYEDYGYALLARSNLGTLEEPELSPLKKLEHAGLIYDEGQEYQRNHSQMQYAVEMGLLQLGFSNDLEKLQKKYQSNSTFSALFLDECYMPFDRCFLQLDCYGNGYMPHLLVLSKYIGNYIEDPEQQEKILVEIITDHHLISNVFALIQQKGILAVDAIKEKVQHILQRENKTVPLFGQIPILSQALLSSNEYEAYNISKDKKTFEEIMAAGEVHLPNDGIKLEALTYCEKLIIHTNYKNYQYLKKSGSFLGSIISVHVESEANQIADHAFNNCANLESVTLDTQVVKIGYAAFINCPSLQTVNIQEGLETIDDNAFYYCNRLVKFVMPGTLLHLGRSAFCGCSELEEINITNNLQTLYPDTFTGCNKLKITIAYEAFLRFKNILPLDKIHHVIIPDDIEVIPDQLFRNCINLKRISLPPSSTQIGHMAFFGCAGLEELTIPNTVTQLGMYLFSGCHRLRKIVLSNSITKISDYSFNCCLNLTEVNIPNGVTYIGKNAFFCCAKLKILSIPNSVIFIGEDAFSNCNDLKLSMSAKTFSRLKGQIPDYLKNRVIILEEPDSLQDDVDKIRDIVHRVISIKHAKSHSQGIFSKNMSHYMSRIYDMFKELDISIIDHALNDMLANAHDETLMNNAIISLLAQRNKAMAHCQASQCS